MPATGAVAISLGGCSKITHEPQCSLHEGGIARLSPSQELGSN